MPNELRYRVTIIPVRQFVIKRPIVPRDQRLRLGPVASLKEKITTRSISGSGNLILRIFNRSKTLRKFPHRGVKSERVIRHSIN